MGTSAQKTKHGLEKVTVKMDITSAKDKVILFFGKAIESAQIRLFRQRFRGQFLNDVEIHPGHLVIIGVGYGKSRDNLHLLTEHLSGVCAEEGYGELDFVQVDNVGRRVA